MDLLDNIATELGFEFHLYVVRDQLFGSKQKRDFKDFLKSGTTLAQQNSNSNSSGNGNGNTSSSGRGTSQQSTDHDGNDETPNSKYKDKQ